MKKAAVLCGVLLLAAAIAISLLQRRSVPKDISTAPAPQQYTPLNDIAAVPRRSGPPATYGPLPTVGLDACAKGVCNGGSVNDILSGHGRIWGYVGNYRSFEDADTRETYRLLSSYLACVGLSRGDAAFCDYLPSGNDAKGPVPLAKSPNYLCRRDYAEVSFAGYASGADKNLESCRVFLSGGEVSLGGEVKPLDFCSAASGGLGNVCSGLSRFVPKGREADCLRAFPAKASDCSSADCAARLQLFQAMKTRSADACPAGERELCSAYLSKSDAACSAILARLGSFYCEALARATKKANGYPGYSPDEVKAAIKEQERLRAIEDSQHRENERIIEENNRKIKKMIGR
jgi:hypothetical protein